MTSRTVDEQVGAVAAAFALGSGTVTEALSVDVAAIAVDLMGTIERRACQTVGNMPGIRRGAASFFRELAGAIEALPALNSVRASRPDDGTRQAEAQAQECAIPPMPRTRRPRRTPEEIAQAAAEKAERAAKRRSDLAERKKEGRNLLYTALVKAYYEAFEAARGRRPTMCARSGDAVWRILAAFGWKLEKATQIVQGVYLDDFDRDRVSIIDIGLNPMRFDREPRKRFGRFLQASAPIERPHTVRGIDDL